MSQSKPGAIIIEGHVQGLSNTRSLGEAGIPVIVVDKTDCIARYSKYCKGFHLSPDFEHDEFADFLLKLAEKNHLGGWLLIPSNDHVVYTLSKHKERLETVFKLTTPDLDIIENIYDKGNLMKIAQESHIPIPVTQYFLEEHDRIINTLKFPVLTKGRYGLSFYKALGKKAFLASNKEELREQLSYIKSKFPLNQTFTQELIPFTGKNKTISFTAFCEKGVIKTHWTGIKLREHPLQFGTATFAQSIECAECYEQSEILLKALNYNGVCEVEYLFDPGDKKYKLIEINARTWLWVGLARACGVDYARLMYDFVNDKAMAWPNNYKKNIKWINPISDLAYSTLGILKGKINPINYLGSILKGIIVNALYEKGDYKPALMYLVKLPSFLRNR